MNAVRINLDFPAVGQQPKAPSAPFRDCVRRIHSAAGLHTPAGVRTRTGTGRRPSEISLICRKPIPIFIYTLPYTWETTRQPLEQAWRNTGTNTNRTYRSASQHVAASGPNRVRSRPPMPPLGSRRSDVLRMDRVINMRQSTVLPPCHTISATLHVFIVILLHRPISCRHRRHTKTTLLRRVPQQMGDPVLR